MNSDKWNRIRSIVRISTISFNVLFALLLLFSCLAPFISPARSWFFAFSGLAFPALVLVNVLYLALWLFFNKRCMLISGIALFLSLWNISNQIAWKTCQAVKAPENSFSVMSFNVKVFDLYSWTQNAQSKNDILQIIKNVSPDVLCIQEFYTDNDNFNTLAALKAQYPYYYFHKTLTLEDSHQWGIVTFSRFPIAGKEVIPFINSLHNTCITTDVVINSDTVRIFNAHLQSIYFDKKDYEIVKNFSQLEKAPLEKSFNKLKVAFAKRAEQADLLHQKIKESPYKVMVCADMNDTPNSYTYRTVSSGLEDSFLDGGCGFGLTYTAPYPFLRIDYIFAHPDIPALAHKTQWNKSSDHFAAYAIFTKP